jgi:D-lactate dehydrogenase
VPEHIFALILALSRKLRPAMEVMAGKSFSYEALRGMEIAGKTLGVVGTGRIGRQVLRLAKAFDMQTIGYDSHPDPAAAVELGFEYVTFPEMLEQADIVSINVPLTQNTYHMFNRETFAKCKRGMILINTARGRIIESAALIEALESGIIAGAGLDVLEDERLMRKRAAYILTEQIVAHLHGAGDFVPIEPLRHNAQRVSEVRSIIQSSTLLSHPNVIVTPHVAFNSHEALERINRITVENIRGFAKGAMPNTVCGKTQVL